MLALYITLVVKQGPQHAHSVEAKPFARAQVGHAVRMDRRWWNFQGSFVWRASAGKVSHGQTAFALQRRLHEGSEGHGELTPIPGKPRSRERTAWRQTVQKSLSQYEGSLSQRDETKRQRMKARSQGDRPVLNYPCTQCGRDYHCRMISLTRR